MFYFVLELTYILKGKGYFANQTKHSSWSKYLIQSKMKQTLLFWEKPSKHISVLYKADFPILPYDHRI